MEAQYKQGWFFMDLAVVEKEELKTKLIEFLEQNNITYKLTTCYGCNMLCIDLTSENNSSIIVQARNKDVLKICPCEILYIAIESRKSVRYSTDFLFSIAINIISLRYTLQSTSLLQV